MKYLGTTVRFASAVQSNAPLLTTLRRLNPVKPAFDPCPTPPPSSSAPRPSHDENIPPFQDPELAQAKAFDLKCLSVLFVAGERADPPTVNFFAEKLRLPVIDHWWQTEARAASSLRTYQTASDPVLPMPLGLA